MCRSVLASLRKFREAAQAFSAVCGNPARLPKRILAFAGIPRESQSLSACLRTFRETARAIRHSRGTSASLPAEAASLYCLTFGSYSLQFNSLSFPAQVPVPISEGRSIRYIKRTVPAILTKCRDALCDGVLTVQKNQFHQKKART